MAGVTDEQRRTAIATDHEYQQALKGIKAEKVESGKDLQKALAKAGVGSKWRYSVTRGGKDEEVVVELGKGL